jgi:hypothetical protein
MASSSRLMPGDIVRSVGAICAAPSDFKSSSTSGFRSYTRFCIVCRNARFYRRTMAANTSLLQTLRGDTPLNVIIIGAGTGGLCLAHGLLSLPNVSVQVFERDRSPNDRLQGYRLSINHDGAAALQSCLPHEQFQRLLANSANRSVGLTFLDQRLHRLLAMDFPASPSNGVPNELPVSRIALRNILLEGL